MESSEFGYSEMCSDILSDGFNLFGDSNFALGFGGFEFEDPANSLSHPAMQPTYLDASHLPLPQPQSQFEGNSGEEYLFPLTTANESLTARGQDSNLRSTHSPTNQESQCQELKLKDRSQSSEAPVAIKRKWEDSVLIFGASPEKKVVQRKRKAFSSDRRRDVHRNRILGACIQCKLRRGPVSLVSFKNTGRIYAHCQSAILASPVIIALSELGVLLLGKRFARDRT